MVSKELAYGVRNPAGVWDWLDKKKSTLSGDGRDLTHKEVWGFFRGAIS